MNENNNTALSLSKKVYEVSIPPGSAQAIEITFPQEGTYVGNDHDIGRFLIGAGFAVLATNSSISDDYPIGTRVPP
jgi:nitrite reductase (NO-forming)